MIFDDEGFLEEPCGDCDNCEHLDGDCCRLIYEEKVKEYKNDR